jgi:ABC-type polysaccharide/polyol phosphate export permease
MTVLADVAGYRDLIAELVARDLKVRYRRSAIGFLWTMLQPLMLMLILQAVFSTAFRFDLPHYPVYALVGVLFWNFFSQTVVASMNSLRGNATLLQKFPIPRWVFPLATVISGVVNLCFALVPLFVLVVATGHRLTAAVLFVPAAILLVATFTLGAGLLVSPLSVFFADVVEVVAMVLTMLFYLTPVFYPLAIVPPSVGWIVRANPLRVLLDVFRAPIYDGALPATLDVGLALAVAAVALAIGGFTFRRSSDRIPYYV